MLQESGTTSFAVATFGFNEQERRVIRNVLVISDQRTPRFVPFVQQPKTHPHIVIVNADTAGALEQCKTYCQPRIGRPPISCVVLSRVPITPSPAYPLNRPFYATRLFQLLERVVIEEHGFEAALAFASDDSLVMLDEGVSRLQAASAAAPQSPVQGGPAPSPPPSPPPSAPPVTPPSAVVKASAAPPQKSGVRALVVDDSLPVRIQLKNALAGVVSHADFAETGEQALELIGKQRYDLIFLDVILPGKDGYEVCRRIKKHELQRNVPVLMLTGNSSPADRVKGKLAGCDTYLIKPIRPAVFEAVVAEYLRGAAA